MAIHSSAVIGKEAVIHPSCEIGPYCVIGANVRLGANVHLHSHVCIGGYTEIGQGTEIFPFASLGSRTQDKKHKGERSYVRIGQNNIIREYVTINPGTDLDSQTTVGDDCLIMIGVHIAHDCHIGNDVTIANNATLAGHVVVGDHAILGGITAYHQFVRIGRYAIIGGGSIVVEDVIPYGNVIGERAHLAGLNLVGMKRHQFAREEINALQQAFREMFTQNLDRPLEERVNMIQQAYNNKERILEVTDFILNRQKRPLCMPK